MQKRRFHSQNAGFEMSAPIGIGAKILAGGDVSLNNRTVGHVPTAVQSGSKTATKAAVFDRACPGYLHCGVQ
jgi:hypothetical protein